MHWNKALSGSARAASIGRAVARERWPTWKLEIKRERSCSWVQEYGNLLLEVWFCTAGAKSKLQLGHLVELNCKEAENCEIMASIPLICFILRPMQTDRFVISSASSSILGLNPNANPPFCILRHFLLVKIGRYFHKWWIEGLNLYVVLRYWGSSSFWHLSADPLQALTAASPGLHAPSGSASSE